MGQLINRSGRHIELASRHRIGRDPWSDLVVDDPGVSGAHAMLVWMGRWAVRDLGSRNGTRVDGVLIPPGEPIDLAAGSTVQIGPEQLTLASDTAPRPMICGPGGTVLLEAAAAIPGTESVLLPDADGTWWLDDGAGQRRLTDRLVFEAGGHRWTTYLDGALQPTREDRAPGDLPILRFRVSRDEEHVDFWLRGPSAFVEVPSRAHHYTLVTLARQRLADRSEGIPEPDAGWMPTPILCKRLRLQRGAVYTHLYRARKQLITVGFPSLADRLIEHRTEATQLRLGLPDVEVDSE